MPESIEMSVVFSVRPAQVYTAWMTSGGHSAMVGAQAEIMPEIGAKFTMWDGYIEGVNLELVEKQRIVQAWRTVDFPVGSPDSKLEINLEEAEGHTQLTLIQTNIPDGMGQEYKDGWIENYFEPMAEYFTDK